MSDKFKTVFVFFVVAIIVPTIVAVLGGVFKTHYEQSLNDTATAKNPIESTAHLPLVVTLWLEHQGKIRTQFHPGEQVTLYYQIAPQNGENFSAPAYFTLFNVSADKWAVILENEKVEAGQLYSLPKGQAALQPGQQVGIDARLRLSAGRWHFKAVVTPEPITSEILDASELLRISVLGSGVLIVEVVSAAD